MKKPQKARKATPQNDGLDMSQADILKLVESSNVLGDNGSAASFEFVKPSDFTQQKQAVPSVKLVEIEDDEEADPTYAKPEDTAESDDEPPISEYGEQVFRFILCLIVFGTLWLCLDMLVHAQYAQPSGIREELGRAINVLPGLVFILYLTFWYPSHILARLALFCMSAIGGSHMIWCINTQGYLYVMKRCPPIGTLWIWSIVMMDLPTAVASLAVVAGYVKYAGLHIIAP